MFVTGSSVNIRCVNLLKFVTYSVTNLAQLFVSANFVTVRCVNHLNFVPYYVCG